MSYSYPKRPEIYCSVRSSLGFWKICSVGAYSTSSPARCWAYLSAAVPELAACLAEGRAAAVKLAAHAARLEALAPSAEGDAAFVVTSARYLRDCVNVALVLRELLLPAHAAAGVGDRGGWAAAARSAPRTLAALAAHRAAWGGRADFPALELDEVAAYVGQLAQDPYALWAPARLAGALASRLVRGALPRLRALGAGALSLVLVGAWGGARARPILLSLLAAGLLAAPLRGKAVRAALPWLSRRYYLLPSAFFDAGPSLDEWAA